MLRKIKKISKFKRFKTFWLSVASALLLNFSFPKIHFAFLAFVALVPFFLALDGKKPKRCFWIGYFTGILFFVMTLYWFIHVTAAGACALILYLSLYFGLFAVGYCAFSKKSFLTRLILLPCLWVGLEFLRAHLLTGFGWVSLGQSQYTNLNLIQFADITGMLGVSFYIVMVNVLVKEFVAFRLHNNFKAHRHEIFAPCFLVVILTTVIFTYGLVRMDQDIDGPAAKIAVVQANIAQDLKWSPPAWPVILEKYLVLTREAAQENPQLIIWPESSFPGYVWEMPEVFEELKDFVHEMRIPLLIGLVTRVNDRYYNSAVLISEDGEVIRQYDKLHLVMFGEYIPLRKMLPFLSTIVPIDDFTAGRNFTLFPIPGLKGNNKKLSVLICFEDTVPELSANFVGRGANLLVNITNDAWFKDTKAPYLHLAASVFRAIENRRGLIRAANTGVSCFIDAKGEIIREVQDSTGKATYVTGVPMENIELSQRKTFYTKYQDLFVYFCFGSILWGILIKK
ncbi:MAG: apolipoprotein N-acyltransferase [Candidatus Omnitrophota bacterium]